MRIDIMTLFPEMCERVLSESVIGRARSAGLVDLRCHNIRDYTKDKHNRVDDTPYGGGMGMVMQTQPIYDCYMALWRGEENTLPAEINAAPEAPDQEPVAPPQGQTADRGEESVRQADILPAPADATACLYRPACAGESAAAAGDGAVPLPPDTPKPHLIYLSPKGRVLTQQRVVELAAYDRLVLLCGHYEGVDQRVLDEIVDEEISIGDYVLTGGELPALVLTDAVCRMLPGVLADTSCFTEESHYAGLLEYPHYTRPAQWHGREVPEVLLSGHHANIEKWRRQESLRITLEKRPDLLEKAALDKKDKAFLDALRTRRGEET